MTSPDAVIRLRELGFSQEAEELEYTREERRRAEIKILELQKQVMGLEALLNAIIADSEEERGD